MFSADALMRIGTGPSNSPAARLLMLAIERADRAGVATFEPGELRELLGDMEAGKPASVHIVRNALYFCVKSEIVLPDPTVDEIRLNTSLVQPEGVAEVGAIYGQFTLMHEVSPDVWLALCSCGSSRTYRLPYLSSGITEHCADRDFHRATA